MAASATQITIGVDSDNQVSGLVNHCARPTAAYVFAALFALLYVVGRVLESRLIKSLFKKGLARA